nr:response regulator transcription factor [Pseudoalteromonas sp. XMcav2-N]
MLPNKPVNILLIEDAQQVAETLFDYFEAPDYVMDYSSNGLMGLQLATTGDYDCIILDIMLPGLDGIEVCQRLRQQGTSTPIIMLTARDTQQDTLTGLNCGADDYIVKPFDLMLLEARIKAVLRRTHGGGYKTQLTTGTLHIDLPNREVKRAERTIKLNPSGYKILVTLAEHSPNPVSRELLERTLWPDEVPDHDLLRRHIYQLRTALDKPFAFDMLQTVPKFGYKLISDEDT